MNTNSSDLPTLTDEKTVDFAFSLEGDNPQFSYSTPNNGPRGDCTDGLTDNINESSITHVSATFTNATDGKITVLLAVDGGTPSTIPLEPDGKSSLATYAVDSTVTVTVVYGDDLRFDPTFYIKRTKGGSGGDPHRP